MPSERLVGYTAAVLDREQPEQLAQAARELAVFVDALGRDDLRAVLTDPSVPVESRRAIASDLLSGRAVAPTTSLVTYAVTVERVSELPASLEWLTRRVQQQASGYQPHEAVAGRSATRHRLDGYATAVFEEGCRLEEIEDELFRFARTIEGAGSLRAALTDMDVPVPVRRGIVEDLLAPAAQAATVSLATYAVPAGRARDYVALLDWLVERTAEERNLRVAEVRSAVALDEAQRERLTRALSRMAGRQVELRVSIDTNLIGGLVALVGDTVIDGSIRTRLDRLRGELGAAIEHGAGPGPHTRSGG
jgi:F-type H+-transporting ATPase subunit delta